MTHPDEEPQRAPVSFRDLWPYIRPFRPQLILALALSAGGTVGAIIQPLVVGYVVDNFASGVPTWAIVAIVALLVGSALLSAFQQLILERSSERFVFTVRKDVIGHILKLPISTLDRQARGDLVSRVTNDVSAMREVLSQGLVELCAQVLMIVGAFVMMALIDPVLLLAVVAVVLALAACTVVLARRTRPAAESLQTHVGHLASQMERALGGIRTIRASRATCHEVDRAVASSSRALTAGLQVAWLKAIVGSFTGVAVQVVLLAVVGAGALRVAAGILTIGELSSFVMYVMLVIAPVALLAGTVASMNEALGAFSRVRAVLALPLESRDGPVRDVAFTKDAPAFAFQHVSFRYETEAPEGDGVWALRDVSFTVPDKRLTAFVGPSGAGKSTVFSLMEQFHDPDEGTITFRGRDVSTVPRDAVRQHLAYVEQDSPALAGTVRENLLVADRTASDEDCVAALVQCNLIPRHLAPLDFLDNQIGEDGVFLSGGERQRLAIARALLSGCEVLLLDEATSNLDSSNELLLQQAIARVSRQCTVVVIAHRLSTVVDADQIVVLREGCVEAIGQHSQLAATSEIYREFVRLQRIAPHDLSQEEPSIRRASG